MDKETPQMHHSRQQRPETVQPRGADDDGPLQNVLCSEARRWFGKVGNGHILENGEVHRRRHCCPTRQRQGHTTTEGRALLRRYSTLHRD